MSTRNYSFAQQDFSWNGIDFREGAARDGFTVASDAPSRVALAHALGGRTVAEETNRGGTITFSVSTESRLHSRLVALEQASKGGAPVVSPGTLADRSSGRVLTFRNCYIANRGDETRGVEASAVAWVFAFEAMESTEPTDLDNVIGA